MRLPTARCLLQALLFTLSLLALAGVGGLGCGSHVELIAPGQPFMLAKPADVTPAIPDGHGGATIAANKVRVPAGWYVVPPPPAPSTRPSTRPSPG